MLEGGLASFLLGFLVKLLLGVFDRWSAEREAERRGADRILSDINRQAADAERRAQDVPQADRDDAARALDSGVF